MEKEHLHGSQEAWVLIQTLALTMWPWTGHQLLWNSSVTWDVVNLNVSPTPAVLWISFLKVLMEVILSFQRCLFLSVPIKLFCMYILIPLFPFWSHFHYSPRGALVNISFYPVTTTLNDLPLVCNEPIFFSVLYFHTFPFPGQSILRPWLNPKKCSCL